MNGALVPKPLSGTVVEPGLGNSWVSLFSNPSFRRLPSTPPITPRGPLITPAPAR